MRDPVIILSFIPPPQTMVIYHKLGAFLKLRTVVMSLKNRQDTQLRVGEVANTRPTMAYTP